MCFEEGIQNDEEGESSDEPVPTQPWEVFELRGTLPRVLRNELRSASPIVAVPRNIVEKIRDQHDADYPFLRRWGAVLTGWEVSGRSKSDERRIEVYGRLDGIWFRAVIADDVPNVLVTFHRVYEKKVRLRIEHGDFAKRDLWSK